MTKYYTTIKISVETHKRIIKARGVLEYKTGEFHSIEKVVNKALDALLSQQITT
jgi:hypothetical protein